MNSEQGTNKLFAIVMIAAFVAVAAITFALGYKIGTKANLQERRTELAFHAHVNTTLYKLAERGDTNQLRSKLGFFVFTYVSEYDRLFGTNPPSSSAPFPAPSQDDRLIASQMRTQVVVISDARQLNQLLTNGTKSK